MNKKNEKLKKLREECGLTQVEIAKKVGISEISYQRIEYGNQRPSADIAIRIADVLKVKEYEIFKRLFRAATPDITKKPDGNPAKDKV